MREHPCKSFGPLKRDFLLGKIQNEGQSAGNYLKSSSETIREAFILDNIFKYWFIGFIEGKGERKKIPFCFSLGCIRSGGQYELLEFKITQSSADAKILFFIKKKLGFGTVRVQDKKNKTHCFKVNNKNGLEKIISLLNGNLCLESRKEEFKLWLSAYNKIYKQEILYIENSSKPSLTTSWLSGFTDAIGCFTCSIVDSKHGNLVKLKYILSQRGSFETMNHLAKILGGKTHLIESNEYRTAVNTTKLSKVIRYFKIYPLKTNKSIIYNNWYKIYKLVFKKKHLTDKELNTIKRHINNLTRLYKQI